MTTEREDRILSERHQAQQLRMRTEALLKTALTRNEDIEYLAGFLRRHISDGHGGQ